ncbi:MAG TPA: hypothetical protein VND92_03890 [Vicinamibacterales bacterium]|nr:hypothetical protein [Vicinamibacterales bacterium]
MWVKEKRAIGLTRFERFCYRDGSFGSAVEGLSARQRFLADPMTTTFRFLEADSAPQGATAGVRAGARGAWWWYYYASQVEGFPGIA